MQLKPFWLDLVGSDINVNFNFENFKNTNVYCNFTANFDDLKKTFGNYGKLKVMKLYLNLHCSLLTIKGLRKF